MPVRQLSVNILLGFTYPLNLSLAGLLCCYKSSLQLGKNEKPGRRHLIEDAKVQRQILDNLLNEVKILFTLSKGSNSKIQLWILHIPLKILQGKLLITLTTNYSSKHY